MGLELPTLHVTQDPVWSQELLDDLSLLDAHNHTLGNGVQIPTAAININADLSFSSFNSVSTRSFRFVNEGAVLSTASDLRCVYVKSGDFWYNFSSSQHVQITSGSGVNIAGTGGFQGDYITQFAVAYFNNTSNLFYYTNSSGAFSNSQIANLFLTNPTNVTVELIPPANSYTITFPTALPAATKIMSLDASGVIGDVYDVNNSTVQVASNNLQVVPLSINATYLAPNTITTNQISNSANIPNTKLAPTNYVTSSVINYSTSTPGSPVTLLATPVSFTASGNKLVEISLIPGAGFGPSSIQLTTTQTTFDPILYRLQVEFEIFIDGVSSNEVLILTSPGLFSKLTPSIFQTYYQLSPSAVSGIVSLSAGAHTININMTLQVPFGLPFLTGVASVNGVRILVNEI
jgi:hypothetical protein